MGRKGKKSSAPGGYGTLNKGYRMILVDGRLVYEHRVIWEKVHGPIPEGMHIHHVNEDRLDNRIENLRLVDPATHSRIHSGHELRDGEWWKRCVDCNELKPPAAFSPTGPRTRQSRCRPCAARLRSEQRHRANPNMGRCVQHVHALPPIPPLPKFARPVRSVVESMC